MPKLNIIICNFNEINFIDECLLNLKEIREKEIPDLEVIVKDQGSCDGSRELIEKKHPWVRLIKGENVGLAKAYNLAYRSTHSEYILFLGMDARPEVGCLPGLVAYFNTNQDVGLASCKLTLKDGSSDMDAHRAFPTPWISLTKLVGLNKIFPSSNLFNGYFLPRANMSIPHEIDLCISHFMFVRRKVLDQINGFDEDFFLYGEDVDLCYRVKKGGWKIMYLPQFKALHLKGGSIGIRGTTRKMVKKPLEHRVKMQRLSTEAMVLFIKKHYFRRYPKFLVYAMLAAARLLGGMRVLSEYLR